jgi:peroxidase
VKLSRILCENGDEMDSMQVYAMVLPDHDINPRVPCKSGVLKKIDFSKWRDASFHSQPAGFFSGGQGQGGPPRG